MVGQYQEAEDITQEVFIHLYQKLHQFDPEKKLSPWVYRIACNTSISELRKKKHTVMLELDDTCAVAYDNQPVAAGYDPLSHFENEEIKQEIDAAIMELPEAYRIVIIMRFQLDLNNQEIADALGISKENVEVKVHRARKALRKVLIRRWNERGLAYELPASK